VRADRGFHDQKFFAFLEKTSLPYALYVRMDRRIQRTIHAAKGWQPLEEDPNCDITELSYQSWDRPRRIIVVGERIRPEKDNRGKLLFDIPDYTYTALLTSMQEPAEAVWRFYNQRADCENRVNEPPRRSCGVSKIKELELP
jgi:hypothetical protein